MKGWEIRIEGIVQGVGFRPTVYRLANRYGLPGDVSNGPQGVLIRLATEARIAKAFYESLLVHPPVRAHITHSQLRPADLPAFDGFSIVESATDSRPSLLIAPDYGLCPSCRSELQDPTNRRAGYGFITCTTCGPRYSIMTGLPYDRPLTTMEPFAMCPACAAEYGDPLDRRHFSQTNSCPTCGMRLQLWNAEQSLKEGQTHTATQLTQAVVSAWQSGLIVAIKGIGGYLLTCDAGDAAAVARLRQRKQRPTKPLAVMYPGLEALQPYALTAAEKQALQGPEAPIVLLPRADPALAQGIAEGLDRVGVLLPYAPLLDRLLNVFGAPIVATSGNVHQQPIVHDEAEAAGLLPIADWILDHDRPIQVPQDDSVIRYTARHQQRIILRRARGLAPTYFKGTGSWPAAQVFAAGADLKAAFGLLHQGNAYLSQYLGALGDLDTETRYQQVRDHLRAILQARPERVLHDLHPGYHSRRLALVLADQMNLPATGIQHHEAHFAAILGEHDLLQEPEPVLGVIWDGAGYGHDGHIWGGEWLQFQQGAISRLGHLGYFPVLGGDKMAREPRLAALSLLPERASIKQLFSPLEQQVYARWHQRPEGLQTSSMGRLFDAVGALLGLGSHQGYEGEVAMRLEALARRHLHASRPAVPIPFWGEGLAADPAWLLACLAHEQEQGADAAQLAASFHLSLVEWVAQAVAHTGLQRLACSGGVFQNGLLVDLLIDRLGGEVALYFHRQLSPNDEHIAFGQIMHHLFCSDTYSLAQSFAYVSRDSRKNTKH